MHLIYTASIIIAVVAILIVPAQSVTLKEFQTTLKIVHDTCQTTTKVPEETLQQIRDNNFVEDNLAKCYVHCFMEMLHLMEGVVPQFHVANRHTEYMIPPELFETTIKAFGHCEDAAKGQTDACEAAYIMLKCFKADGNDFWFK